MELGKLGTIGPLPKLCFQTMTNIVNTLFPKQRATSKRKFHSASAVSPLLFIIEELPGPEVPPKVLKPIEKSDLGFKPCFHF